MLTHDEAIHLLSARADGELTAAQEQELQSWLSEHPDGKVMAEAFQTQDAEVRLAFEPRRAAAARTAERVIAALPNVSAATPRAAKTRWRSFLHALPPFACAIAVAFVAFFWLRAPQAPKPPDAEIALQQELRSNSLQNVLVPKPKPTQPAVAVATIGQQLTTGPGNKQRTVLPDGSAVYLDQNTSATLVSERKIRLERGRIFVEAVPADAKAGREAFQVWTPRRKLEALGTKFAVSADDKAMSLLVTQGSVKVEGAAQPILAGQQLKTEGLLNEIVPARSAAHDLDWMRELIVAADTPLVPAGKYNGGALVAVDPYGQEAKLSLVKCHIDVHIEDGFARTTIDQTYFNHENFQMEGTFYFPLPPDASLSRLAMYVANGETCSLMEGGMAERDYARQTYERIRHARRDPALLEWIDGSLFKMRVFPLEARQEKRLILSYSQKLPVQYGRTSYRFPAGHTLNVVNQWSFEARVKNGAAMQASSPSHPTMKIQRVGDDLVLKDRADMVKADRDVVLDLVARDAASGERAMWSSAEHDGHKYLMLRYRPELPGSPKRERRDWVFLFEASGARDPLVARAQVEVIRALLNNAEHDDTFALLTVGTRVHKLSNEPLLVNEENIKNALDFLDRTHLIGALNLDQGLREAAPYLANGRNAHLVHLGGGVATLGEQRTEQLISRLPSGTRYVGVAVGKRFSPSFMKNAAEKTGGLFTRINPDESLAWRGFELAASLNTPRLLNASVHVSRTAHESPRFLPISTSIAQGEEFTAIARVDGDLPQSVTIRGTLDGAPFERTLSAQNVNAGANYLPRTWAKLEIDRLVAENASKHRQDIIALSKAMYVMTPFTSLLVLENEAMYKEFNVDRGRKDHWAMYPCPDKMPTTYIPDPNLPADRNAPQFTERKPHENVVRQTVLTRERPTYLSQPGPNGKHSGFRDGKSLGRLGIVTSFGTIPGSDSTSSEDLLEDDRRAGEFAGFDVSRLDDDSKANLKLLRMAALQQDPPVRTPTQEDDAQPSYRFGNSPEPVRVGDVKILGNTVTRDRVIHLQHMQDFLVREARPLDLLPTAGSDLFEPSDIEFMVLQEKPGPNIEGFLKGRSGATRERLLRSGGGNVAPDPSPFHPSGGEDHPCLPSGRGTDSSPRYYARPSFTNNQRVFVDLVAYAPGMSSSRADIQAVVEAEAAPRSGLRRGSIDPEARKRIDAARSAGWRSLTLKDETGADFPFFFDGQGRYAYERRLQFGLIERVACDGSTILHLYPELGIGARRTVSRFHRAELASLLPDLLVPADDLNFGFDVKAGDAGSVILVPVSATLHAAWVETQLFFAKDRLIERRWINMPSKKEIGREVYGDDGAIRVVDGKGKEIDFAKRAIKNAAARDVMKDATPQAATLVVLPLPLRSREHVYRKLELDPQVSLFDQVNRGFDYLTPEQALELFAAEFAADDGSRADDVWHHLFAKRGDNREGFFTLIQSAGYAPRYRDEFTELLKKERLSPLMRYLALALDPHAMYWQQQLGLYPGEKPADNFLDNLLVFRSLSLRWQGDAINDRIQGNRPAERERALAFVKQHADNSWGWATLGIVADHARGDEFYQQIAETWGVLAKDNQSYAARYEQAASLVNGGKRAEACAAFRKLFEETIKKGVLPPLDQRFANAFQFGAEWRDIMQQAARAAGKHRQTIILLAWQCRQLGDRALADELLETALRDAATGDKLAAINYLFAIEDFDQADRLVREVLQQSECQQPPVWRLAGRIAERRGDRVRQFECLDKALDGEFAHMPDVFSVEPIRRDYKALLEHYQHLAESARDLKVAVPADLLARTIRAADRWRSLDQEANNACDQTARILRLIGNRQADELAWDYLTTPLALRPNEAEPWLALATSSTREGNLELADQCYEAAFAAEPTNAQILWDRAKLLERRGEIAESRRLMQQLATTKWQPRFEGLKAQAKQAASRTP